MQSNTILLILVAALAAGLLVFYQYYYKAKTTDKKRQLMASFRFIAIFSAILLLVNPQITKETFQVEQRKLLLVSDNSRSLLYSNADTTLRGAITLITSAGLDERFDIRQFNFGAELRSGDSLSFSEPVTNIGRALRDLNDILDPEEALVILLTDGNQTFGTDYEYLGSQLKYPLYSLVVGDTTQYEDLRIDQVNLNRYAFLDNTYPLESFLSYQGKSQVSTRYSVYVNEKRVHSEIVRFSRDQNAQRISTLLNAESVGIKKIRVELEDLPQERNKANNVRNVSLEVLDEQTKVALVTDIMHPDIGALRKAIESNDQRAVSIIKPTGTADDWDDFDMFILYQPNAKFRSLYQYLEETEESRFTITGTQTDWIFLNSIQSSFIREQVSLNDEILAVVNKGFTAFDVGEIDFWSFPPLLGSLGEINISKAHDILLEQRIRGVDVGEPLLAMLQENGKRETILFGENLWKWRMQSFRNHQNFEVFDAFVGKIIRFLSSNSSKSRLSLEYERTILGAEAARIQASYFDKAYQFDGNAELIIQIKPKEGNATTRNMLLKSGYYEVDLSDLQPGDYDFTIDVQGDNVNQSGSFTILDYDVERLFLSSDYQKLDRLSKRSAGKSFFPHQIDSLIQELEDNPAFVPRQRSEQNVVSLIDYKFLLLAIVLALAIEWFLRKYHGLI